MFVNILMRHKATSHKSYASLKGTSNTNSSFYLISLKDLQQLPTSRQEQALCKKSEDKAKEK